MIQHACFVALSLSLVLFSAAGASEDSLVTPASDDSTSSESPKTAEPVETVKGTSPEATTDAGNLAYTSWDFEIDVHGFQHEPAGKNLDEFNAKLRFAAVLPHASSKAHSWSGFGKMDMSVVSRAANSDQAPHRAAKKFGVQAQSFWDHQGKMVQVIVHPKDAVTYSLLSGPVLGTTGILELALDDATFEGLAGTALKFAIPENAQAGAAYHCRFDTSGKHTCWFEGQATLKVLSKNVGNFSPASQIEAVKVTEKEGEKPMGEAKQEQVSVEVSE